MNKYEILSICLICLLLFSVVDAIGYQPQYRKEDIEFEEGALDQHREKEEIFESSPVIEDPIPFDGDDGLNSTPTLSVLVDHPEHQEMQVLFYNNETDTLIDDVEGVPSGERAEIVWENLNPDTEYSWHVVADDGENETQEGPWSFSTPTIDYVRITDDVNGTALEDRDVPPEQKIMGYLSSYNETYGFFDNPKGEWEVSGGNASLDEELPEYNEKNGINVGDIGGFVWFNVTLPGDGYTDSVRFNVITDEIGHIQITGSPDGEPLKNQSVSVGERFRGYCSVYNESGEYIYTVEGNWSAEGADASLLEDSFNESNVIDVGLEGGRVWFNVTYDEFHDSVRFEVSDPEPDDINITDEPDGAKISDEAVSVGFKTWGNASGYNDTAGFIGTVEVNWSVDYEEGMNPTIGDSPAKSNWIDVGTTPGYLVWKASYEGNDRWINDTVEYTVEPGEPVEFVFDAIESQVAGESFEIGITAYDSEDNIATGYNGTAYLSDTTGTIDPDETGSFSDGTWTGEVAVKQSQDEVIITATDQYDEDITGTSDLFTVGDPEIDHIRIISDKDDPSTVIDDLTVDAGDQITGYSAGFNDELGFVKLVEANWFVDNHQGAEGSTSPNQGNKSLFDSGPFGGESEWSAEYDGYMVDTVNIQVNPPTIDNILIRSEPDGQGDVLEDLELEMDDEVTLFSAGYNDTFGYQRDVEAEWEIDEEGKGELTDTHGPSTTFIPTAEGDLVLRTSYEGIIRTTEITVVEEHVPEIIGDIPDLELEINFGLHEIDLSEHASDDFDPPSELEWFLTGTKSNVISIYGENQTGNHVLTLLSEENATGRMEVTYWLVNSQGNKASQEAWINVTREYEAPGIRRCPDLYVHYEEPYQFDYSPYIIYNYDRFDELVLETDDDEHTSVDGLKVTYDYPREKLGEEFLVTISVSDGQESASTVISVTVTSNYPPVNIEDLPDVTMKQGELKEDVFNLDDYFTDPDGDPLYMSYGYTYLTITIHDDHSVDIRADGNWYGTERVTFRAKNPIGGIVEQTINVTVIPVNYPPEIKELPPFVIHHDEPYVFDLEFYIHDPDNETHELTITTCSPEYVEVDRTELIMNYPEKLGDLEAEYEVPLEVKVSDGIETSSQITTVTVGYHYPPELVIPLHDVAFKENEQLINAFNLDNHFIDRQEDTMYYSSGNDNIEVVIHENSSIDFYARENWNGQELITIRATNSAGALMEDSLRVTVIPVNNPPVISDIPRQEGEVGRSWILDMGDYISDVDNETHELEVMVDDPYVEVYGHKLLFNYDQPGKFNVTVYVSDGLDTTIGNITVYVEEQDLDRWYTNNMLILFGLIPIGLIGAVLYVKKAEYTIEDIFLIHDSGVLIKYISQTRKVERDEDILAGMFTAVQNFVDDAFAEEEDEVLKRMEYGNKKVLVHKGENIILAVFISGDEPKWALEGMKNLVADIEERYGVKVKDWSGDLSDIPGIDEMMDAFNKSRGKYKPGDWRKFHENN